MAADPKSNGAVSISIAIPTCKSGGKEIEAGRGQREEGSEGLAARNVGRQEGRG